MASQYNYITTQQALVAIRARLYNATGDASQQQWTNDELILILNEALRTWNALSGFWRSEFTFTLAPITWDQETQTWDSVTQTWDDLGSAPWWTDLRTVPGTNIPYAATQNNLIEMVENHLLEPPNFGGAWYGSAQFALSDIWSAFQRRQDETLSETACTIKQFLAPAPLVPRTFLPDSVIDIRRVAWLPVTDTGAITWDQETRTWNEITQTWDQLGVPIVPYRNKPLRQSDMFATRAFNPNYTISSGNKSPGKWMQNAEPPLSFDVDYIPPVNGRYDVLAVEAGPAWNGANPIVPIPTDWTWVLKWGALMDLLSRESNASDAFRAQYCKQRYEEGKALLRMMPTILALRLNNIPQSVGPLRGADDYNPYWQSQPAGKPKSFYSFSNMLAATPPPDGIYSVSASTVQNAPIVTLNTDPVQCGRDEFDTILDLCQHLAMFKAGGAEFAATIPLYIRAQRQAALSNSKLKEMGFFSMTQLETSTEDERQNPRYMVGATPDQ